MSKELSINSVEEMLGDYIAECCETQLLGYGESDTTGVWAKFRLPDRAHLEKLDGRKNCCYMLLLIELDDDSSPKEQDDNS